MYIYIHTVNKYFGVMFMLHDFIKFLFLSRKIVSTFLILSLGYSTLLKDMRIF